MTSIMNNRFHALVNTLTISLGVVAVVSAVIADAKSPSSKAWELRKIRTSNVCLIETRTSSPIGELVGDYDSRELACQAAKKNYDDSSTEQSKCWAYGPATRNACKDEGIELPKNPGDK